MELHILVVHDGSDTSEHFLAAPGEEILHLGVPVKWVPVRIEEFLEVKKQGRHPNGTVLINAPRELQKIL
jgi:hypothetical protein